MLADQAGVPDIAREQRQQGSAAAGGFAVGGRRGGEAFVPDLPFVTELRPSRTAPTSGCESRHALPLELSQRLGQPTGQGEVIEVLKARP